MKKFMTAAMFGGLMAGTSAHAADAPAPATQPTVSAHVLVLQGDGLPGGVPQKMEKAAWLGVGALHPPEVLMKQLKIKAGLVVAQVEPKSPADAAGLKVDDVIEKLDDQLLINPSQFETLVRMHHPGDSITLTVLREGQRSTMPARLIEHDVLAMRDDAPQPIGLPSGSLQVGDGANTTIQIPSGVLGLPGGMTVTTGGALPPGVTVEKHVEMMTRGGNSLVPGFESQFADENNEMTVVHRDKQKILIIKDHAGKQLFEGPIDTAEQQAKIPKDLQGSFQSMQKMAAMADKAEAQHKP